MIVASTPAGLIPSFLANVSIPGEIAKDVPNFLGWLDANPEPESSQAGKEETKAQPGSMYARWEEDDAARTRAVEAEEEREREASRS